ncbi:FG-GAP-like repeat-containing protein [Hymenobacter sp. GOD-10R]|uniref:FG-GAP-like repeat-containing protein n=1 Tax=Hymenobacter sp. GOD-10R TaxID=3093922 RepID=UPI002D77E01E|nr:FG-GAP-like repeat-containing protein [Hymenobacter sp. GOD-10R]WRQ28435.1 FG-GAP-like repeat-containing protein [Hymenobacter sp. GOD-10R]
MATFLTLFPRSTSLIAGVTLLLAVGTETANAQAPIITSLVPARNARSAPRATNVTVGFSQALNNTTSTQQALKVFSQRAGGKKAGLSTVSGSTLSFNPTTDFKAGETVFATVTTGVQSNNQNLAQPQVFQFTTAVVPSPGKFGGGSEVVVGSTPLEVILADIDGDSDLDVLTTISESSTLSISLNNGSGVFAVSQQIPNTTNPTMADVDSDGDLDLVTPSSYNNPNPGVTIRLNNGNGVFSVSQELGGLFNTVYKTAAGDMDGDGDLDLVTSGNGGLVFILTNNGTGTFSSTSQPIGSSPSNNTRILLGDVDNDGDLDVVVANYLLNNTTYTSSAVYVYLNNGPNSFSLGQQLPITVYIADIAMGDVDGDTDLDLVVSRGGANSVSVLLNNSRGLFSEGQAVPVPRAQTLALGDVDGDGDFDLLTGNYDAKAVDVRLNNGNGTFASSQQTVSVGSNGTLGGITLGDVDNDGDLDFVTANSFTGSTLSVRLNQVTLANAPAKLAQKVSVYPNPTHAAVHVLLPAELATQRVQMDVVNALGQVVLSQTLATQAVSEVALPQLTAGVYSVQLRTAKGLVSKLLVIE